MGGFSMERATLTPLRLICDWRVSLFPALGEKAGDSAASPGFAPPAVRYIWLQFALHSRPCHRGFPGGPSSSVGHLEGPHCGT